MSVLFRLKKYLAYQWQGQTKYYIHSPFVYRFFLNVLENSEHSLAAIEKLRADLQQNTSPIHLTDYGTKRERPVTIAQLEKQVAVHAKYGRLLYSLTKYLKPNNILELGTSIGLSSSYLKLGHPSAHLLSLEGSDTLIDVAHKNHRALNITGIEVIQGEFSRTLPAAINKLQTLDLVFFDGNHQKEATLNYFKQCLPYADDNSVFVFDDIYWSEGMAKAWEEIKQHPQVTLTIDVYQFGICFFRKDKMAKEDFVLRY